MSKSSRFTLEDVSRMPRKMQLQVAEQLGFGPHGMKLNPAAMDQVLEAPAPAPGPALSESASQIDLVSWWKFEALRLNLDERVLIGLPLQGKRTYFNACQMKREGQRQGTPDLFLAVARGDRGGLWIEMKTQSRNSKLRPAQKEMLALLSKDYATVVCRGTEEAQKAIRSYLSIS